MTRWQRYWFDDGGRHALAIVRICVALAVLLALARLGLPVVGDAYRPVGIWMLAGDAPPPASAIALLVAVAWVATLAMLLGLWTRTATATSAVAGIALAALSTAHQAHWSHVYNIVFLGRRAWRALARATCSRSMRSSTAPVTCRAGTWSRCAWCASRSRSSSSAPRFTSAIADPARLCARLVRIRHEMTTRYFPDQPIGRLVHYRAVFEVAAYPAPARFVRRAVAITAVLDATACRPAAAPPP